MSPAIRLVAALLLLAPPLAACSAPPQEDAQALPPVVLTQTVQPIELANATFVGVVMAQVEVKQAFLLGGRLTSRPANLGESVAAGDVIASLDATLLELSVENARANLTTAQAQSNNATATAARAASLVETDTASQATLDAAQQGADAASASVVQAQARLDQALEQLSYAQLTASVDGVVTSVGAEAGQTVSAGATIVTLAQPGTRDVVIDVPEQLAARHAIGDPVTVWPQLSPDTRVVGSIREMAAEADPVTRLWRIRVGLPEVPDSFWLGTTANAVLEPPPDGNYLIPATALREGGTSVLVVGRDGQTLEGRDVTAGPPADGKVAIASGLSAGDIVVVAGVDRLQAGQAVRVEGQTK